MLLLFDVVRDAIPEHDDWHTHEHLPERLSIPGFVRGTRWVASSGQPGYFVMYEVEQLATLTSSAYLERLNNPTPWTSKMMPSYRGMNRGFCSVAGSFGVGMGHAGLLIRFSPATGAESLLREWLLQDILPRLPSRPGIGSVHLFEGASTPSMTAEQRLRGADAGVDRALLVTGYSQDALASLMRVELDDTQLETRGATGVLGAMYRMEYSVIRREVEA
ncbi:hypothetical protein BURK1_00447 [Burkholderiales bacterium]|nr:hypothetical protein BURK1_00447 [Burkholderiales bacterium]